MKTVKIPTSMKPFVVYVNGEKYIYEAGTEQEVPDEVAVVIEQHQAYFDEKAKIESGEGNQGGGTGGGGSTCKLTLNVIDPYNSMYLQGNLDISNGDTKSINVANCVGTTEYEIPCGSIILLTGCYHGDISHENLTKCFSDTEYCGNHGWYAPLEAGASASLTLDLSNV